MTEDEAKTKWCPFARAAFGWSESNDPHGYGEKSAVAATVNRGFGTNDQCLCIGSACMAWRWDSVMVRTGGGPYKALSKTDGHCGLAGKP